MVSAVNKPTSPTLASVGQETMMGASGNIVTPSPGAPGVIGATHGGSYTAIAPPGQQQRGRTDEFGSVSHVQSQYMQKNVNYPGKSPSNQLQDASSMKMSLYQQQYTMGQKMTVSQPSNTPYSMQQTPQQKPPTPQNQSNMTLAPSSGAMKFQPSQMKTFQTTDQAERAKQQQLTQQFRQNQVQGILSRPFTGQFITICFGVNWI